MSHQLQQNEQDIVALHKQIQKELRSILAIKRKEKQAHDKKRAQAGTWDNIKHHSESVGRGVKEGAVGIWNFGVGAVDTSASSWKNIGLSAWEMFTEDNNTRPWFDVFAEKYTEKQRKDMIRILGFDVYGIDPRRIAEGYEVCVYVLGDKPSRDMLYQFIKKYLSLQSSTEVSENIGTLAFDFILAAVLLATTGGAGNAAQIASKFGAAATNVKRVGQLLIKLTKKLKVRQLSVASKGKGKVTGKVSPPKATNEKLLIPSGILRLKRVPTSGVPITSNPNKTTTILGNYRDDMRHIIDELKYPKTENFGAKKGDFNVLNVPDDRWKNPDQFWKEYNQPFLDKAIARGDDISMATNPIKSKHLLRNRKGELTGFGREYMHLINNGYTYNPTTSMMVK